MRGLALRSLCNLRLKSILEYVGTPISKALLDPSAYVRKTAIMSILKLNTLSAEIVRSQNYLPKLFLLLEDVDPAVVINTIFVLDKLLEPTGLELDQSVIMRLVMRIGDFSGEWELLAILDQLSRYQPKTEDEVFHIMNLLDPLLTTSNSSSVMLAILKCFFCLTCAQMPELHSQILSRAKPSFVTLLSGSNFEVQYTLLKHLEAIVKTQSFSKGLFDEEFRHFFVKYHEPSYVKYCKVDLLPHLTNEVNAKDVISELVSYATDVDAELSKRAINSLGQVSALSSATRELILGTLLSLIDLDIAHVTTEAVKNVAKVSLSCRGTGPNLISDEILMQLASGLNRLDDFESKVRYTT